MADAPISYARQLVDEDDVAAVVRVLRSDRLTQGPEVEIFEAAIAAYCGAPFVTAVSSGTAALHLACLVLDVGPGDVVWTSANSFVASANCARYCGARVEFVDIDTATANMSAEALERQLESSAPPDRPKVVIVVHYGGQPADLDAIARLGERFGFAMIEDASHALGATYGESRIGACDRSVVTAFSFHAIKNVTTGEGGAVTTRDPRLHRRLQRLRSHGITRSPSDWESSAGESWYYEQHDLGYNYRLTDMQSALGTSQLRKLPKFLTRRTEIAAVYDRLLDGLPLATPVVLPDRTSAWHLYPIRFLGDNAADIRDRTAVSLAQAGIATNVHYVPIPMQPYYRRLGARCDVPNAIAHYRRSLSLPMHAALTEREQTRVAGEMKRVLA